MDALQRSLCEVIAVSILQCLILAGLCLAGPTALTIDHRQVDSSVIPSEYVEGAASLRMLLRHASVGQGIDWGLDCLAGLKSTQSACSCYGPGSYDRGHWALEARTGDGRPKIDDLVSQVADRQDQFSVFMMKYCYIDALGESCPDWDYYRSRMEQLEAASPAKTFVWWTIPLTRVGQPGSDRFNGLVRSYCASHSKILFDVADIECHDLAGVRLTNAQGDEIISSQYTNEVNAGHLNTVGRIRVAGALWHLMARIAGWPSCGPEIFVDGSSGDDGQSGLTSRTAIATIQRAIDRAEPGTTVVVAPGTYREAITMKEGVNVKAGNPANTILDGRLASAVVKGASRCRIEGFTITGYAHEDIDGVYCQDVNDFVVAGNVIKDNTWSGISAVRSHIVLSNNLICNNRCAGIFVQYEGPRASLILNNTVVGNQNEADIALWHGARAVIVNNILADVDLEDNTPDAATLLYNDVFGQAVGGLNFSRDPLFADPNVGDYHLRSQAGRWQPATGTWVLDDVTSPCIDAGEPNSPCSREPCPHGGRINMGAYGGTPEASKSYQRGLRPPIVGCQLSAGG